MRRIIILCAALSALLFVLPGHGAIKTCNASRISAGDCASGDTIILYAIPTTVLLELADDIAEQYGWPSITCAQADVTAGRCSAGQLGSVVTTPETKNNFANRMISEELRRRVHNRRKRLAAAAAEAGAAQPGAIE
jgi:hypothetical protein